MDPTATLREMIEMAKASDYPRYCQFANALYYWLRDGGFEPEQTAEYNVKYI